MKSVETKKKSISIFILMDALGWTYVKDSDFLKDEALVKMPVKSILGFSSAAIPSILTGKMPEEHGFWSLFLRDENGSPFSWSRSVGTILRLMPGRVARKAVEEVSKRYHGYTGYFETYLIPLEELPSYDISERRSIYAPGGLEPTKSIFDLWEASGINYKSLSYKNGTDGELFAQGTRALENEGLSALFIYLSGMDAFLHAGCEDKEAFSAKLALYEEMILKLINTASECYNEVRWFLFSDHGMTPTIDTVDLMEKVKEAGLKEGKDYKAFYDSTMARFWFADRGVRDAMKECLGGTDYGRWINAEEREELGLRFTDNRYGDEVFIMRPGVIIEPSYMGDKAPDGMHGFHPDDKYADASFFTNVNNGYSPKCITGFFDVMREETLGQ
jgi:hypothetical protein